MKMYNEKIMIEDITPPFNFDLTAMAFSDKVGLCMRDEQICKYSDGKWWSILRASNKLALAIVKAIGSVDRPKLEVSLVSNEEIFENEKKILFDGISRIFDLKFDLKPFYTEVRNDEVLSKLIEKLYGLKVPHVFSIFEAFVYVILEQQISLRAAYNIERKFIKKYGDLLRIDSKEYYAFPTPEKVASLEPDDLRMCGISRRKAEYIINIAKLISENKLKLEELEGKKDEEILQELCKIRGVGRWTAELVMISAMGRSMVIPAADLGLREHIARYYLKGTKRAAIEEVRQIAERWGRWKGIAGYYITIAGRLGIECG
jgi:DNA-3-methyladenine glycosylase II